MGSACVRVFGGVIYLFLAPGGCSWQTWEGVGAIARRIIARGGGGVGGVKRGDPEAPGEAERRFFSSRLGSCRRGMRPG